MKNRAFAAKLAHEISTEGKIICPNCQTEIKKIKLIRVGKSKNESWAPKYSFQNICKCNENEIFNEK